MLLTTNTTEAAAVVSVVTKITQVGGQGVRKSNHNIKYLRHNKQTTKSNPLYQATRNIPLSTKHFYLIAVISIMHDRLLGANYKRERARKTAFLIHP